MMRIVKLCLITLLVLEVLAIIAHFDELLSFTGNMVGAFMPVFIMMAALIWMIKKIF
ncbi:hypothetical protein [Blautia sp. An249]|uniref:hypothetical protein n=1 Tax=Blautia sp. An249 TaxID=1965603 RepID=UPI0013A62316|nr:hypothetical protein [Blautia sp. An249]